MDTQLDFDESLGALQCCLRHWRQHQLLSDGCTAESVLKLCRLFALIIPSNIPVRVAERSASAVSLFFSVRAGGAQQAALGFPVGRHGALDSHSAAIAREERHG